MQHDKYADLADILGDHARVSRGDPWRLSEAREQARQRAHALSDPSRKVRALQAVREVFGDQPTSRTLATYGPRDPEPPLDFGSMTDEQIDAAAIAPVDRP